MQQKQEQQKKELVLANLFLSNLKRKYTYKYQTILQKRDSIAIQKQKVINVRQIQQE